MFARKLQIVFVNFATHSHRFKRLFYSQTTIFNASFKDSINMHLRSIPFHIFLHKKKYYFHSPNQIWGWNNYKSIICAYLEHICIILTWFLIIFNTEFLFIWKPYNWKDFVQRSLFFKSLVSTLFTQGPMKLLVVLKQN